MSVLTHTPGVYTSTGNLQVIISNTLYGVHVLKLVEPIIIPVDSVVKILTGFNNPPPG